MGEPLLRGRKSERIHDRTKLILWDLKMQFHRNDNYCGKRNIYICMFVSEVLDSLNPYSGHCLLIRKIIYLKEILTNKIVHVGGIIR